MNKLQETLKAGLGNGLICYAMGMHIKETEFDDNPVPETYTLMGLMTDSEGVKRATIMNSDKNREFMHASDIFPHLFPLSMLTKPIRIEGVNNNEPFVPIQVIAKIDLELNPPQIIPEEPPSVEDSIAVRASYLAGVMMVSPKTLPHWIVKSFDEWHINWRGLDETKFIDATISKAYEPK